jgi:DinB superfamily
MRGRQNRQEEREMRATDLLQRQFQGINDTFHAIADDLTDAEWIRRALPQANLPGFTLWHITRTQDCAVQTLIRGVPSVLAVEPWVSRGCLATAGIGTTFTLAQADHLSHAVSHADMIAYADAVHHTILNWLDQLTDDELDATPDLATHYQRASFPDRDPILEQAAIAMAGRPIWQFLVGPCLGHTRDHLAELELFKRMLRGYIRGDH